MIYGQPDNLTDAEIAAAYNAEAAAWKPVPSSSVGAWLAETGLGVRLERWVDENAASVSAIVANWSNASEQQQGFVRLFGGVKAVLSRKDTDTLDLSPGSTHRAMLAGAIAGGLFSEQEAGLLIARAMTRPAKTEEDVAAERSRVTLQAAKDARLSALESFASAFRDAVNAATSAESLPVVPSL